MTLAEKIELASIPLVGLGFMLATPAPRLEAGSLLLFCSGLFLLQGLLRDLWLLVKARRDQKRQPSEAAACMCLESTLGVLGVTFGVSLLGAGISWPITLGKWGWSLLPMLVMALGFGAKDFVFGWRPWRFKREKDHQNIIVKWW